MIRSIEFRAMNTAIMLAAEGDLAIEGMQAAKSFLDESEQRFSRFLPASELTELNRSAGEWIVVSKELMEMLQLSLKYHDETHAIFDPTILPDLKRVGYDRSMDDIRSTGIVSELTDLRSNSRPSLTEIEFDLPGSRVRLPSGMEIDLGGIAKSWIVERTAELLRTYVDVCAVSAGGDIVFIGQPSDGMDWDVYLEDPRDPSQMLAQLHITKGAVATSSISKRSWIQGKLVRHHLIDPRSGEPARTEWLSVTAICSNIIEADVYAKAILIGGMQEAIRILMRKPDLTFIAVDAMGDLTGSTKFKEYIYEPATDIYISNGITTQAHH
jgi:FAD:protein FMN transferase